jgi:hypothetical protein
MCVARRQARETCSPTIDRTWHSNGSCVCARTTTRADSARGRSSHATNGAPTDDMATFPFQVVASTLHSRATLRPRKLPSQKQFEGFYHEMLACATLSGKCAVAMTVTSTSAWRFTARTSRDACLTRAKNISTMHAFLACPSYVVWLLPYMHAATGSRLSCTYWCLGRRYSLQRMWHTSLWIQEPSSCMHRRMCLFGSSACSGVLPRFVELQAA